jgi:transposase
MQLRDCQTRLTTLGAFATSIRCPICGDPMVAPVASEFIEGDEIRHHWECDACGEPSSTSIPLTSH